MADIRFHPWTARLYDYINLYFEHRQAPPHREYLAHATGDTVLEIGVGTGTMLSYFEDASFSGTYYGIEPDSGMRRQARERLAAASFDGEVLAARAEQLPVADGRIDTVVASCVFCSIPDITSSLSEVARVLDTDGEFRFFEHVKSPGIVGRSQEYLTPLWRRFGGNCHLDREFVPWVEANASLELTAMEYHTSGHYPIREFVRGRASPRDDGAE